MSARFGILLVLLLLAGNPSTAASRELDLDAWIAAELAPYLSEQLATHPRFRQQSLRFVVLENGQPQATSNALAIGIRDRLRESASGVPGVRLAWQPDDPHSLGRSGMGGIDCTKSEVQYLVGVELNLDGKGVLEVALRALDVQEGTAVPGFGKKWKGVINSRQYRDFRSPERDPTFRGEREVPYEETQTDLLASHLAHDMACRLLRQTETEYVIEGPTNGDDAPGRHLVELVSNNLARYGALQFTGNDESANALIEGRAHRVSADLYQYWITVQPGDTGSARNAISASAYIRLEEKFAMAERYLGSTDAVIRSNAGFLVSLEIVEKGRTRDNSFALSVHSNDDAVVFFLNHQLNNGLVRLADASCLAPGGARVVRSTQQTQFPLPPDALPSPAWTAGDSWPTNPDLDTYFALAARDSKAARALSRHVRKLPERCTASVRPGLEGDALREWLDELTYLIRQWGPAIDWRTIRVRNVY